MRWRVAQFVLAVWLFSGSQPGYAQSLNAQEILPETSPRATPCATMPPQEEPSSGREISISNVTFSGFVQMPISDQDDIASAVKRNTHGSDSNGVIEEALEWVRTGWQDRGYFKVEVSADARAAAQATNNAQIALFVLVDENAQYRLGGITFKNNKAIHSERLRDLFLINDRDIFSRAKIAEGLENLRKAYGEYGYINYTGVPTTSFDDEKKLAYLEINVDEGKQFYVSDIHFEGLDGPALRRLTKEMALKPGDIYNSRLWGLSVSRIPLVFPGCTCNPSGPFRVDERKGAVAIILDHRSCLAK